jgi:hypothetical protein
MRRLSPWYPLDYPRLLWWLCVTPARLRAYRDTYGLRDERRLGRWLASTLTWLPWLLLMLACATRALPFTYAGDRPNFVRISLLFGGLWLMSGLLAEAWAPLRMLGFVINLLGTLYALVVGLLLSSRTAAGQVLLPLSLLALVYGAMMCVEALVDEAFDEAGDVELLISPAYFLGLVLMFGRDMKSMSIGNYI